MVKKVDCRVHYIKNETLCMEINTEQFRAQSVNIPLLCPFKFERNYISNDSLHNVYDFIL